MSAISKLMQARDEFHKRELKKSGWNDFSKFKYLELADFLIPALEIFSSLKLAALTSFTKELATMTITDLEDGSSVVITSPFGSAALKACHEVQNIGAVETYQRRYLWIAALEIVEHDAIDSATKPEEKQADKPAEIKHQSVPKDSWDLLTAKEQKYLTDLAIPIKDEISAGNMDRAYELRMQVQFDEDRHDFQQAGFISLFSPPERTALKKYRESISMKKAA